MRTNVLLRDKEDFRTYQNLLDTVGNYSYDHTGKPVSYPCVVMGSCFFEPDADAPYTYFHVFKYPSSSKCSHCGHVEVGYGELQYTEMNDVLQEIRDSI